MVLTSTAGTTISDFTNDTSGLGQATGALILGTGLALVLPVRGRSGQTLNVATTSGVLLFWIAFVLTAPGVLIGNILSRARDRGGLDWGNAKASATLVAAMALLVGRQTLDIRRHPLEPLLMPLNRHTGPTGTSSPLRQAERREHIPVIIVPNPGSGVCSANDGDRSA